MHKIRRDLSVLTTMGSAFFESPCVEKGKRKKEGAISSVPEKQLSGISL